MPGSQPATSGGTASVGDAFNWGWTKFQENIGPILIATLILFVGIVIIQVIVVAISSAVLLGSTTTTHTTSGGFTYTTSSGPGLFVSLVSYTVYNLFFLITSSFVWLAIIRATLAITYGRPVDVKEMLSTDQLGQYIIGAILVGIGTAIGFLLCIIPGIIFMFMTIFWGYFLVDKKLSPVESIKASIALVNKNVGTLIGFFIACIGAYILGAIVCGIGLLVAIPVVVLSSGYMYRKLQGESVAA